MNYAEIALQYCHDVLNDTLPNRKACKLEKLSCQRHLNNLAQQDDPDYPYYCDDRAGIRHVKFLSKLRHSKGKWRGQLFVPEPHQIFYHFCLFAWKKKSTGFRRFNKAYLKIPRKNGKAISINTPLPTPLGWTTMSEVKVGDLLFDESGEICTVLNASPVAYDKECFKVTFDDNSSMVVDKEHLWTTFDAGSRQAISNSGIKNYPSDWPAWKSPRGKQANTIDTEQILKTLDVKPGYKNHSIPVCGSINMPEANLEVDPFILGVWLGDGSSSSGSARIAADHLNGDQSLIREEFHRRGYLTTTISDPVQFTVTGLLRQLFDIGVVNNKHVPQQYLRSSVEQRMDLLRGLMLTDGTITVQGQVNFENTNENLIESVLELAVSLGQKARKQCLTRLTLTGKSVWRVEWSPTLDVFGLGRKSERLKIGSAQSIRHHHRIIRSVVPVESVPVKCISIDSKNNLYLAGRHFVPTHNSFSSAGIGLYMAFADGENGAECYCAATTEAQAGMVFAPAWSMVHMDNDLKEAFGLTLAGTIRNPTSIYRADDLSRMEPIIGTPKDGSSPSCGICDELHEHPSRALYDSLDTGMGAREAPLLVAITTAGINISSFCYELELEAIQILEGTLEKENVFVMIFGIDVDDDWRDFEVWRKANPNLGVSINEEYLLGKYQDAMTNLSQRAILLTKHCNVWANAGAMWCDMNKWNENARPDIKIEQFLGKKATIAIDLASKIDIVAVEIMFELEDMQYKICPRCGEQVLWENETYICSKNNAEGGCSWQRKSSKRTMTFSKFYLPESTVLKKENNHYQLWANEGLLTVTEGERTDFQKVEEDLQELCKLFIVSEIVFDPKEAAYLIQNIQKWFGGECIECNQSPAMLSEPMKECEAMIVDGCFLHDGNKVLTWMFGNVIRRQGKSGGNVKYAYPSKQSEGLKIDGAVACITGLSRIMTYDTDSGDSYNARAAKGQLEILRVI